MNAMRMKKCPTCIGNGYCVDGETCPSCEGTGEMPAEEVVVDEPCQPEGVVSA